MCSWPSLTVVLNFSFGICTLVKKEREDFFMTVVGGDHKSVALTDPFVVNVHSVFQECGNDSDVTTSDSGEKWGPIRTAIDVRVRMLLQEIFCYNAMLFPCCSRQCCTPSQAIFVHWNTRFDNQFDHIKMTGGGCQFKRASVKPCLSSSFKGWIGFVIQ
jgi:hypothetical protein